MNAGCYGQYRFEVETKVALLVVLFPTSVASHGSMIHDRV